MIRGIGIDIVSSKRIIRALDSESFRLKVYTDNERNYIKEKQPETAAGLFAAKEAAAKALGTGFFTRGVRPCDIEITHDAAGKPSLAFHGQTAVILADLLVHSSHISISHEGGCAAAIVLFES